MKITEFESPAVSESNREIEGRYLTFWIDRQLFGVSISEVVQIVGVQPFTTIPQFPSYSKGIMNLRGAIIPVIDVRLRLGKAEAEYNDRTCIIVINNRDRQYGLIVDEVEEVTDVKDEDIAPPPQIANSGNTEEFLTGVSQIDKDVLLLIDAVRLVGDERENKFIHQEG